MRSWGAEHDPWERLRLLRPLLCFPFIAGILLSWPLWQQARHYPLAPVADWLRLPWGGDLRLSIVLLALLLLAALTRWRWPLYAALGCFTLLALLDQSRLQPWAYMYALLLLVAGFADSRREALREMVLPALRLVLCADYFWSGLKKLNTGFAEQVFPWFIEPVTIFLPDAATSLLHEHWYIAALAESGLAFLLFFPRTRELGVFCAVSMHLLILFCLGPLGHNWNAVVWPWNIALVGLVLFAFGTTDVAWHAPAAEPRAPWQMTAAVLLVCGLLPALSFWNRWDEYLSFALYSGNVSKGELRISEDCLARMPATLAQRAYVTGVDEYGIDLYQWSFDELSVPAYPAERVFITIARRVTGRYSRAAGDVELVIHRKAPLFGEPQTLRLSGRMLAP